MEAVAARTGTHVVATHCDGTGLTVLASAGTATDPRITQVAIGQRLIVTAPISISWMAFAGDTEVNTYLADVKPLIRERCREVLAQIRQHGFALGSSSVQHHVGAHLERHVAASSGTQRPSVAFSPIEFDPDDYNPALVAPDARVGDTPDVVNLWAPSFDPDGTPCLGFTLAGFPIGTPLLSAADVLLELTRDVTRLAAR